MILKIACLYLAKLENQLLMKRIIKANSLFFFVYLLGMLHSQVTCAQTDTASYGYYVLPMVIEGKDTIALVDLRTITIYPTRDLSRRTPMNLKYIRLAKKVRRVYPYARLAVDILQSIYDTLPELDTERQQRRFLRAYDKALRDRYMDELKKLKVSEGRILLKLIDRETGYTSYNLVRALRGKLSAMFWQSLARIFGENLKTEYNPRGEDRLIEEIVVKIESGRLEPLPLPNKKD
ncbi:hypothetical protein L21SP5_01053 [Salinivirga cyanobacteriivorans]|uniref:DUF4294 domain-containing protein n=2 Tax=Salinivirga cyanobacteriivorans TaxID=1307839 RepID=A0A0S2HXF0_9BACT|nr:hypothetical protein L21SP5_01053 [Salinivirga cyanobacteriivorans]